jgi:hypothetical protein
MSKFETLKKLRYNNDYKSIVIKLPIELIDAFKEISYETESDTTKNYDFILLFSEKQSDLESKLKEIIDIGKVDCIFWICYPKGGGKIKSDINRNTIWKSLEKLGLRPVSQVALDNTWSALRARSLDKVGK